MLKDFNYLRNFKLHNLAKGKSKNFCHKYYLITFCFKSKKLIWQLKSSKNYNYNYNKGKKVAN